MGSGKEGPSSSGGSFLVCSYTDVDVLAHLPKGETATESSVTSVRVGDDGHISVGSGVLVPGPNPAFALKHPELPVVYVSTECIHEDGEIFTLQMEPAGGLQVVGKQTSGGKSTCFLQLDQELRNLISVSYWDAKVATMEVGDSGELAPPRFVHQTSGGEYVQNTKPGRIEHWTYRQRWPHSHCVALEPYARKFHFVTDLGLDRVFMYKLEATEGKLEPKLSVELQRGRGPRHILYHPRVPVAYVGNELDSTLTVLRYNPDWESTGAGADMVSMEDERSPLRHLQTLSSLPEEEQGKSIISPEGIWKAASHSSELRLRPDGRFLYIGNRGHDSIAVYRVDEEDGGRLSLVEIVPSGGSCPRNFNFREDGRFLLVGNQNSNTLVSFACCPKTGRLTQASSVPFPSPNYVYCVPS